MGDGGKVELRDGGGGEVAGLGLVVVGGGDLSPAGD